MILSCVPFSKEDISVLWRRPLMYIYFCRVFRKAPCSLSDLTDMAPFHGAIGPRRVFKKEDERRSPVPLCISAVLETHRITPLGRATSQILRKDNNHLVKKIRNCCQCHEVLPRKHHHHSERVVIGRAKTTGMSFMKRKLTNGSILRRWKVKADSVPSSCRTWRKLKKGSRSRENLTIIGNGSSPCCPTPFPSFLSDQTFLLMHLIQNEMFKCMAKSKQSTKAGKEAHHSIDKSMKAGADAHQSVATAFVLSSAFFGASIVLGRR